VQHNLLKLFSIAFSLLALSITILGAPFNDVFALIYGVKNKAEVFLGLVFLILLMSIALQLISMNEHALFSNLNILDLISAILIVCLFFANIGSTFDYFFTRANNQVLNANPGTEVIVSGDRVAYLNGEIGYATFLSLIQANETETIRYLELDSPGGIIEPAILIGNYLREEKITAVVVHECASACALIAFNSHELLTKEQALFGFHNARSLAKADSERGRFNSELGSEIMFSKLAQLGIPEHILNKAKDTAADEMYYVSGLEFVKLGLARQITN